ncbi:MAG TPA: HAD family phosphatase [Actinomycetota bacterium]
MAVARGLLIDFGGVLTTPLGDALRRWCEREGVDADRLRELLQSSYPVTDPDSIVIQVETGRMPPEEFERRLAEVFSEGLHRPLEPDGLLERMGEAIELEPRMIDAVRIAHAAGVRTALISNSWGLHYYPHDLLAELFDEILISGQVGLRKPEDEIYLLAARGLGLEPPECVFVDDVEINLHTAERLGMRTLLHEEPERTIVELEALLGVPLGDAR